MSIHRNTGIVALIIIVCAVFFAALIFLYPGIFKKRPGTVWREDFIFDPSARISSIPAGWKIEKKPGTKPAVFSIRNDPAQGGSYLNMEADRASASLLTSINEVDITQTPILRWRWRATVLPEGADGRSRSTDDQAIGIYIGTGSVLSNKSVSYRWDTLTPKGAEGNCAYGMGGIKVKWYTLRNKEDLEGGKWFTEERNVAEDFKNAWGFYPEKIYLSISCNSQYTKSRAAADLDLIEFIGIARAK
jgi:hypothetical protein